MTTIEKITTSRAKDLLSSIQFNEADSKTWDFCLLMSTVIWAGFIDGRLACIWGVIPPTLMSDQAYLWLYTTDVIKGHEFLLVRHSQLVIDEILDLYPSIVGHAIIGSDKSIRWLKWLGAKFGTHKVSQFHLGYLAMADPMSVAGIGLTAAGGLTKAVGAQYNAQAQQVQIQGSMLSTIGQAFGMQVQAEQYGYEANKNRYQAAVADMNKKIALQNVDYSLQEGEVEAQQSAIQSVQQVGLMKATQGTSNISVNTGSSVDVRQAMVDTGYYNQAIIRSSAAKKAYGYDIEAAQYGAQADLYRYSADEQDAQAGEALKGAQLTMAALPLEQQAYGIAGQAGNIASFGSLVGAAGSVANKWIGGSQVGVV